MDDLETVLGALEAGEIDADEARDRLSGIGRVGGYARVDRELAARTGVPEVVEAGTKRPAEVDGIASELLDATGRAIVADPDPETRAGLEAAAADSTWHECAGTLVLHAEGYEPPEERGTVAVATAGTADIPVAEAAAVLAGEMGCTVETRYDVGVSSIGRLLDERDALAAADCVIAAAGREGALATVVAGLVPVPVIGLPVGTGTGLAGGGEAALLGMLQSCTYLTVVNIDAGYAAGAQAALIARTGGA